MTAQHDRAIEELQTAVKLQPNLAEAQTQLGLLLQRTGDVQAAVAAFQRVVRLEPDDPDAHNNLGTGVDPGWRRDQPPSLNSRPRFVCGPTITGYRTNLGTAYLQKSDFDAAAINFRPR